MKIVDLGDGCSVQLPDDLNELTKVMLIDKNGKVKSEIWGTVIAITNGRVLELL